MLRQCEEIRDASELQGLKTRRYPWPGRMIAEDTGGEVQIEGAGNASGHASGFDLAIIDELGLLQERQRAAVMGMRSSTSAKGGRFVALTIHGPGPFVPEVGMRPHPRCARPGLARPECPGWPDHATILNPFRRPLPAGTPRARDRYRLAGLCVNCGRRRDRPDRLAVQALPAATGRTRRTATAKGIRRTVTACMRMLGSGGGNASPPDYVPSAAANAIVPTGGCARVAGAARRTSSGRTDGGRRRSRHQSCQRIVGLPRIER